ncbi:hypothetical protein N2152v2_002827 [Parachlorella kessleri]
MAGLEPSLIARRVRTAAAESSADDKGSPQNKAARASDTQGYRLPLFLAYSALGAGLTFGAGSHLDGSVALALASGLRAVPCVAKSHAGSVLVKQTSTLWMGFVLAISLTEAWVKFRAPLLDRHVAVDVGRHVFPALNSVEAALGVTCGLMAWRYGLTDAAHLAIPGVMAALVAAQIIWLTPALGLRAQHLIASSADPAQLSPKQQAALAAIKRVCSEQPLPPGWLHGVYGALEVTKVVLLGAYIWKLVGQ